MFHFNSQVKAVEWFSGISLILAVWSGFLFDTDLRLFTKLQRDIALMVSFFFSFELVNFLVEKEQWYQILSSLPCQKQNKTVLCLPLVHINISFDFEY